MLVRVGCRHSASLSQSQSREKKSGELGGVYGPGDRDATFQTDNSPTATTSLDLSFSVTSPPRWVTGAQNVLPPYPIHRCHECRFRFRWISAKNAPWAEPGLANRRVSFCAGGKHYLPCLRTDHLAVHG